MINVESLVFEMWDASEEEIIQAVMETFLLGYSEAFEQVRRIIEAEESLDEDATGLN